MAKELEVDKEVQGLQFTFSELKKRVMGRKMEGYDTYISELLINYGAPQIHMFEVSRNKDDYQKCLLLFREIDRESKIEELKFVTEH